MKGGVAVSRMLQMEVMVPGEERRHLLMEPRKCTTPKKRNLYDHNQPYTLHSFSRRLSTLNIYGAIVLAVLICPRPVCLTFIVLSLPLRPRYAQHHRTGTFSLLT